MDSWEDERKKGGQTFKQTKQKLPGETVFLPPHPPKPSLPCYLLLSLLLLLCTSCGPPQEGKCCQNKTKRNKQRHGREGNRTCWEWLRCQQKILLPLWTDGAPCWWKWNQALEFVKVILKGVRNLFIYHNFTFFLYLFVVLFVTFSLGFAIIFSFHPVAAGVAVSSWLRFTRTDIRILTSWKVILLGQKKIAVLLHLTFNLSQCWFADVTSVRGNWASHVIISRPSTLTYLAMTQQNDMPGPPPPPQTASAPPHAHRDTVKNGTSKRFTKRSQLVDKDATVVSTTSNKFASTNQRSRFWVGGGVYLLVSRSPPTAVIENSPAENKASRLVETRRLLVFSAPPYSAFPGWGSALPSDGVLVFL